MRVLLLFLVSAIAVFAEDPQAVTTTAQLPDNLSIPARLSKTIDTRKCKAGDAVEMRTLEPVLVGNGLVMPENAKLHGKIAGAASRQNDKPSWVVLVVESAEWKQHRIPLHAFIASQITLKAPGPHDNASAGAFNLSDFRHGRYFPRTQGIPGNYRSRIGRPPTDATDGGKGTPELSDQRLDDVYMQQARNGIVFLLSPKAHLKLPLGTMFMLRNQPAVTQTPVGAQKAAGNPQ
jgi:hypothetical protein